MIVVTGAAGFIASCFVAKLNTEGERDVVIVDDFSRPDRARNYQGKRVRAAVERADFFDWIRGRERDVRAVVHLGARTDTVSAAVDVFDRLNVAYSQAVWRLCAAHGIRLIYASSAATYGVGELGYSDDHALVPHLKPLNAYGRSKQVFDEWALDARAAPPAWFGLKFFNVYGPNEAHKGRMASVAWHAFGQIRASGAVKLFRSEHPAYSDGEQQRDFVYVHDVVEVVRHFLSGGPPSGLYNVGTGAAGTFRALAAAMFKALSVPERILYIDMPTDLRDRYQYHTEADVRKLRTSGYRGSFTSVEDGVTDYARRYLLRDEVM